MTPPPIQTGLLARVNSLRQPPVNEKAITALPECLEALHQWHDWFWDDSNKARAPVDETQAALLKAGYTP
jgi:hypothetical protein